MRDDEKFCNGRGNVTAAFLRSKFFSKVNKLRASFRISSCSFIMDPKTSTSSGNDNHCAPGMKVIRPAKKRMIEISRDIIVSTLGCNTLIATEAVGTETRRGYGIGIRD